MYVEAVTLRLKSPNEEQRHGWIDVEKAERIIEQKAVELTNRRNEVFGFEFEGDDKTTYRAVEGEGDADVTLWENEYECEDLERLCAGIDEWVDGVDWYAVAAAGAAE